MSRAFGIIADDFTGALFVAGYLESAGVACPVLFDVAATPPAAPVVVLATRSRLVPVAEALEIVTQGATALTAMGCARIAYKACASFDSTAQGNIGPAADLLADTYGGPVLYSAGFPAFGATVHQGYLFYRGRLVSDSIKQHDPLTPMTDPDLARFLSLQSRGLVSLLPHSVLRQGTGVARAALNTLLSAGADHVLLDATDDGDVEISADLAAAMPCTVAASDPLIVALARRLAAEHPAVPPVRPGQVTGEIVVLAGSVGPVVLAQLATFGAAHRVLTLDLLDAGPLPDQIAAAVTWATSLLQHGPVAITTATDTTGVTAAQAAFGPFGAARRAEGLLAGIAAGLHGAGIRRFVVAGGETSGAVVGALGIGQVRALAEGPLGCGFCVTEGVDPIALYLKPGKVGADDILLRAVDVMKGL